MALGAPSRGWTMVMLALLLPARVPAGVLVVASAAAVAVEVLWPLAEAIAIRLSCKVMVMSCKGVGVGGQISFVVHSYFLLAFWRSGVLAFVSRVLRCFTRTNC